MNHLHITLMRVLKLSLDEIISSAFNEIQLLDNSDDYRLNYCIFNSNVSLLQELFS